jgi:hypothetical protein
MAATFELPDDTSVISRIIDACRARLFAVARRIANALDEDFTGHVEIHICRGGVGTVKVVQSFRPAGGA